MQISILIKITPSVHLNGFEPRLYLIDAFKVKRMRGFIYANEHMVFKDYDNVV